MEKEINFYDQNPKEVGEEVERITEEFLSGEISGREYISLMMQGRVAPVPYDSQLNDYKSLHQNP